jgi:DNA-binding CsgD family transcriptional regulator
MPSASRRVQEAMARAVAPAEDVGEVFARAAGAVARHLDPVLSVWSTMDPADLLGTSCRIFDRSEAPLPVGPAELVRERHLFELEWQDTDPNTFAALRRSGRAAAGLRHDVANLAAVRRYRELLQPHGLHDELRLLLTDGDDVWGTAIVYRADRPFGAGEVALAASVAPVVARALRRTLLLTAADHPSVDDPPGTLVLDGDDRVVVTSPAAEVLLARLDDDHVRTACTALAARVRTTGEVSTTVIGAGGVVAFHAGPAKGLDGGVTIVVDRPRPAQLAPLILRALGLTARERVIAEALLQGFTRRQIAARSGIAEDTVDDHLKHIYRKADVPGRAALSALLFERFYAPNRQRVAPGPYGWFLPPT